MVLININFLGFSDIAKLGLRDTASFSAEFDSFHKEH